MAVSREYGGPVKPVPSILVPISMRIKAIHFKVIAVALLASACVMPSPLRADPVKNRSMTTAASQRTGRADDVFLSPMGLVPPERKTTGWIFHRSITEKPSRALGDAVRIEAAGDWKRAISVYDRIVRSYPYLIEAAEAQLRIGRLQEKRGKYKKAFEEYRYLLYYYPESAPADVVLKQMYAIANYYEKHGEPAVAMDLFQKIYDIAPKWKYSSFALLHLGMMQARKKKYLDAAATFDAVMTGYPRTSDATRAASELAAVRYALANKYPEDDASQIRAISSATTALVLGGKNAPDRDLLSSRLKELEARRFNRHYQMAAFYDTSRYPVETKIAAYRDFLRRFPKAPQATSVRARLAELENPGSK